MTKPWCYLIKIYGCAEMIYVQVIRRHAYHMAGSKGGRVSIRSSPQVGKRGLSLRAHLGVKNNHFMMDFATDFASLSPW